MKPLSLRASRDARSVTLTADGEMLLGYARRMLAINREAVSKFIVPDISGVVRIGQLQGDECLRAVTAAVQACLHRSTDLLARYGGEELAVLLPDTNQEGAQEVAQRMLLAVRGLQLPHENSTVGPFVTVSIGVSAHVPYPKAQVGGGAAALMAAAEEALYRAKTQGSNRWAA